MNSRQQLIFGIGIVIGVFGVAILLVPDLSLNIRIFPAYIAIIALIAFALTFYFANVIFKTDYQSINLPNPEHRTHAAPGDGIDRQINFLSTLRWRRSELSETYNALHARLRQAALSIFARHSLDDEQPRKQLIEGTWTDNAYAAAFFGDPFSPKPSLREQLRSLRTGEPPIQHRARHTVAALVHILYSNSQGSISSSKTDYQGDTDNPSLSTQPLAAVRANDGKDAHLNNQLRVPDAGETIERRTGRWQGVTTLALAASAAGILLRQPPVLLASGIGVGLAAYSQTATPPPVELEIERTVSDTHPAVGSEVRVTVTIQNVGDTLLPDCSVIDGVPPGLVVMEGSPRYGTALRPGKTTTFSYTLSVARGEHTFAPAAVIARDFTGSVERLTRIETAAVTTITCVPQLEPLDTVQLRHQADRFGGRVTTDIAGTGVEFHAVREYQPNDPRSHIDWNGLAKRGELSTLQFREERVTTVVLVIDARNEAYLASEADECSAVDRSVEAAGRVFTTLLDDNTKVGVTALSSHSQTCWLAPGTGNAHHEQARQILAIHPALAGTRPTIKSPNSNHNTSVEHLRRRLSSDAQVIVLTPLCDDEIIRLIGQLESLNHAPTVISPDPSVLNTPGRQLAHIERILRITSLRSSGVPVLNWLQNDNDPLSVAINRLDLNSHSHKRGSDTRAEGQYER